MKTTILSASLLALAVGHEGYSQTASICKWDHDKQAAVVLTFDDWTPGQFPIAVQELKKRDFNATFFVMEQTITATNHSTSDLVTAASYGNEIGNHTVLHPDLTKQSSAQISSELRGMKKRIETIIPSEKVVSFAYPFGAFNQEVIDSLKQTGHISSRSVMNSSGNYSYNFAPTEDDYFKILTYGMDGKVTTAAFAQQVQNIIAGGGLLTYLCHSVDDAKSTYNDKWYATVLQDSLIKQFDVLVAEKNKIWVTTMGQAVKYHREANCAKLTEVKKFNGKRWVLNLTDTLSNNTVYNQPLSIKIDTNGKRFTQITQNNKPLSFNIVDDKTILFEAIPDGGEIVIKGRK